MSNSKVEIKISPKAKKRLVIVGIVVVCLFWILGRIEWIPAGHVGLIYNARSGLKENTISPQAIFVGPFDQLYTYPTKLQAAIYNQDDSMGESRTADGIQITTNDAATTTFDVTVFYRVKPEDVVTVFNKFGPIPIEQIQSNHIRRAVREGASIIGNQYDVFQLLGPKRLEASQRLTEELRARLSSRGITILIAMLNTAHPTEDIQSKITGRVNSYTQLEIAKLEQQIAEYSRQSAIVRGEAENESRKLTASQTQGTSVEMLKLEMEADAIEKWKAAGGKLSPITVKPGTTLIINGSGNPAVVGR
jgi:hypothetical protein